MQLSTFAEQVDQMHCESNLLFSEDYQLIKQLSSCFGHESTVAKSNPKKNRYTNILPYDHARVKITPNEDDEESTDYINASFIPGYAGPREYIAAQGPLKNTISDFWRMVWKHQVKAVVMVTQPREKDKIKCEVYWPQDISSPVICGDLEVHLRSESNLPDYVIRVVDLHHNGYTNTIHHFHFLKWPDFGCPDRTNLLLKFVKDVRNHTPNNLTGPVVVHCSAGVGRSGTYIALDTLLQQINDEDRTEVDIFSMVLAMRNNRPHMVQAETQYIYIHDCLRDALDERNAIDDSFIDDDHVYQNTRPDPTYSNLC